MAFNSHMHPRNIYRNRPNFTQIALDYPLFRQFAIPNSKGVKVRVDFSNPAALRMLTEILLKKDFNLDVTIPQGFLIPTVPQRLNYILWLEDLLHHISPDKKYIGGIDIGTGPCAIFSLLGVRNNGWNLIATESSEDAIHWAKENIEKNNLSDNIRVVKVSPGNTLSEILSSNQECYDFCLCNPPFFENSDEIRRKNRNSNETIADFAKNGEIFFKGGELNFVKNILNDSLIYKNRICLFTSMFGKKRSFLEILKRIKGIKDVKVTTTEFCQGNTIRWGIAWTFNESIEFKETCRRIKPKKTKPPLEYQIPLKNSKVFDIDVLLTQAKNVLKSLKIPFKVTRSSKYFAELLLKSDKNTWTHQRRKRRELERQKNKANALENPHSIVSNEVSQHQVITTESEIVSGQNVCTPVIASASVKNRVDLKGDINSESISMCTEAENISEHCEIDTQIVASENHKIKAENICSLYCKLEISESEGEADDDKMNEVCSKPILNSVDFPDMLVMPQIAKRKDFSNDHSSVKKKLKLDIGEKNENIISETIHLCIKTETNFEDSRTHNEIKVPNMLSHISCTQLESQSKIQFDENLPSEENVCPLERVSDSERPTNKNESFSLEGSRIECDKMDDEEDCPTYISEPTNDCNVTADIEVPQSSKQKEGISSEDKTELDVTEKMDISIEQRSVLYCHMQLIKGKNQIYVKINCPSTANRNSMYQVFQLIKNRLQ